MIKRKSFEPDFNQQPEDVGFHPWFFADNVLLAFSNHYLQHLLGRFAAECKATRLKMRTSKSKAMVLDRKRVVCPLQGVEMSFLCRVTGRYLREGEKLVVEPLFLHVERSQLWWLRHLFWRRLQLFICFIFMSGLIFIYMWLKISEKFVICSLCICPVHFGVRLLLCLYCKVTGSNQ